MSVVSCLQNPKFKQYREYQADVIDFVLSSTRPIVAVSAPTGSGKSLIGMVCGIRKGGVVYLTHSRDLQVQLADDFPECVSLWGRANYVCNLNPGLTANECVHSDDNKCQYVGFGCKYRMAKRRALNAPYKVLNYSYFLNEANYVGQFSNDNNFVVCDEADVIDDILTEFVSFDFSRNLVRRYNVPPPGRVTAKAKDSMDVWRGWATELERKIRWQQVELARMIADIDPEMLSDAQIRALRFQKRLDSILAKLELFKAFIDESWLFEDSSFGYKFSPVWLNRKILDRYFWRHGDQFVLMSATLPCREVLAFELDVPISDIDYIEVPSSFPASNRPIVFRPVADMTHATWRRQIPVLLSAIEKIMQDHTGEKGVIHSVSYELTRAIVDGLHSPRIISHDNNNRTAVIESFKRSRKDVVLVSPSTNRGVSYDGDMCRFVIWPKAPYLNLSDKRVRTRLWSGKRGRLWYKSKMLLSVLQGAGRAVRNPDDYATTYLLDRQIVDTVVSHSHMLPLSFREAIR